MQFARLRCGRTELIGATQASLSEQAEHRSTAEETKDQERGQSADHQAIADNESTGNQYGKLGGLGKCCACHVQSPAMVSHLLAVGRFTNSFGSKSPKVSAVT